MPPRCLVECAAECAAALPQLHGAPDDPDQLLRDLTSGVWAAFPTHPPYGGAHDDVVPHLTVAERAVRPLLPVTTRIDRVLLIAGAEAPNSWQVLHQFNLAGTGDPLR